MSYNEKANHFQDGWIVCANKAVTGGNGQNVKNYYVETSTKKEQLWNLNQPFLRQTIRSR